MASIRKPETVVVELNARELELIRAGLQAFRAYVSAGEDDVEALSLLSDLQTIPQ
ncbi:hypothetical protein ACFVRU_01465 [Streptomyces sp. NPDC057927]